MWTFIVSRTLLTKSFNHSANREKEGEEEGKKNRNPKAAPHAENSDEESFVGEKAAFIYSHHRYSSACLPKESRECFAVCQLCGYISIFFYFFLIYACFFCSEAVNMAKQRLFFFGLFFRCLLIMTSAKQLCRSLNEEKKILWNVKIGPALPDRRNDLEKHKSRQSLTGAFFCVCYST